MSIDSTVKNALFGLPSKYCWGDGMWRRVRREDLLTVTWECDGFSVCLLSTTSSTASSCDTEFTKEDEQRLKDYIQQLKNDRAAVKLTMLELESIHIDPLSYDVKPRGDSQRLDLENAVLMQELMAMKVSVWGLGTWS